MGLVFNIHIIHLATGCPFPNSGPQQQSQCVTYQLRVTPKLYIPVPGLGHSWGSTDDAFAMSVMDVSANPQRSDAKMQLSKGRGEHGGYSFGVRVPSSLRSSLLRSLVHMLCGRWEIRRLKCSLGAPAAPLVQGQPRVFCPRSWAVRWAQERSLPAAEDVLPARPCPHAFLLAPAHGFFFLKVVEGE